jgi:hypothetical protein
MQMDFQIYNPPADSFKSQALGQLAAESEASAKNELTASSMVHGAFCTFTPANLTDGATIDNFESVNYQFSAQHTPIYTVGNQNPSVHLVTAEQSIQVAADNILDITSISGKSIIGCQFALKDKANNTLKTVTVNGRLNSQNVGVSAGDVGRGQMSVTEPLI